MSHQKQQFSSGTLSEPCERETASLMSTNQQGRRTQEAQRPGLKPQVSLEAVPALRSFLPRLENGDNSNNSTVGTVSTE